MISWMSATVNSMRGIFVLLCAVYLLVPTFAQAASPVVENVRLGQHGDKTRIVLESNKPIKPQHFTLPTPPRFVMDFSEINFKKDLSSVGIPEDALVESLRQGHFKPGVTRMVMDLKQAAVATVFAIPPSKEYAFRLVVDLRPATQEQIQQRQQEIVATTPKKIDRAQIVAPPVKKKDRFVVVIDPGHGGVDPGAIGYRKTYEKDVVLRIGKRLKKELQTLDGVDVYMTREKDVFIPLADRTRFAQRKQADLFISLHADAHKNRKVSGGSVYVLSDKASDKEAGRLARHANEGDLIAGIDLSHESTDVRDILIDLTQRETMNKSALLAKEVMKHVGDVIKLRKNRIMFAGFKVLKAPEIPSVLIEMSYISNPGDERNLKSAAHQTKLARAIKQSVKSYMDQNGKL